MKVVQFIFSQRDNTRHVSTPLIEHIVAGNDVRMSPIILRFGADPTMTTGQFIRLEHEVNTEDIHLQGIARSWSCFVLRLTPCNLRNNTLFASSSNTHGFPMRHLQSPDEKV